MITTVQIITRIVFVSIYLFSFYTQFKEPLVMDFRIYCCPIREFRTVVNFYSSFANQVDYVALVQVLTQVLAALDLLIFFKVNSSQDRQIWRVLTQDLRIILISPVPVQLTLNTPIFLSQKVFFSVSSCSNPTNSPLLSSEVMQNMPRKFFTSGDGQKINVCCSDGASSNENDYVGRKSARCQAKAQNCCYQCYYQQIVEVRPRKINSKGVSLREKRVYILCDYIIL